MQVSSLSSYHPSSLHARRNSGYAGTTVERHVGSKSGLCGSGMALKELSTDVR